jgi:hypothetical protein
MLDARCWMFVQMAAAVNSGSVQGQQAAASAATETVSTSRLRARMEQTPRHRSYLVEELNSDIGSRLIDNHGFGQQAKMCIDLLGRCVSDSPVIEAISSNPSVALAEIGGN